MPTPKRTEDYDSEPVRFCSKCYSLKIKYEEVVDMECCMDCGCSDISESSIDEWERLYEGRYGHKFTVKSNDIRRSPIFKLSLKELKTKVSESTAWQKIIHYLYPKFPGGLGKADSVILLFDKLVKDNRLDDLRTLLVNKFRNKEI